MLGCFAFVMSRVESCLSQSY